ncbi:MAG TPA: SUMF1/EgtB/PvdO family nonheme iron enzyme, partial [Dehalococcoidia bacterium]|nr:SUMF1/EgtB/PvdO family nonheme iron enzyme [Dehalococcoidia bacterium]
MSRYLESSDPVAPDLACISGGVYWIGDDSGRQDERPSHRVELSGFWAARAPVTNADYARFLAATGRP